MTLLDTRDLGLIAAIVALGWVGIWLLLPHRHGGAKTNRVYAVGAMLASVALLMILPYLTPPGPLLVRLFFYAFSILALSGGVLMITARNPVYSALWFAVVVLSSSGLFLLAGAQFLAAGTVIVYAGAIVVTFLFVIMLAQSHGQAAYDRSARKPLAASLTSMLLLGALLASIVATRESPRAAGVSPLRTAEDMAVGDPISLLVTQEMIEDYRRGGRPLPGPSPADNPISSVVTQAVPETARLPERTEPGDTPPHVAALGGTLFTDHLLTVEVVGLLLFVALIGAVSIATPRPPIRPDRSTAGAEPGPGPGPGGTS